MRLSAGSLLVERYQVVVAESKIVVGVRQRRRCLMEAFFSDHVGQRVLLDVKLGLAIVICGLGEGSFPVFDLL